MITLGSFWDHLGSSWDHFRMTLRSGSCSHPKFPPGKLERAVLSIEMDYSRHRGRVVPNLFSNFQWVRLVFTVRKQLKYPPTLSKMIPNSRQNGSQSKPGGGLGNSWSLSAVLLVSWKSGVLLACLVRLDMGENKDL